MTAGHNALRGSGGQHFRARSRHGVAAIRSFMTRGRAVHCGSCNVSYPHCMRPIRRAALRDADVGCIANTRDFKSNLTDLKTSRR